jgi:Sporulation and spore germination
MRRLVVMSAAMAMLTVIAACGLPGDEDFQSIDRSQDGFGLWETSTTTSTTAPTTTIDATTSSTIEASTSTVAPTELVDVYFPTGRALGKTQSGPLAIDPTLQQVIFLILDGPPEGDLGRGFRSILPSEAAITATNVDGVAVVDFPEGIFDDMDPIDQRLVFGQIVLTLSRQRGVGPVQFTQAGQKMSVYLGNGSLTAEDDTVSAEDYTILVNSSGPPIETTTTTTTVVAPIDPAITLEG